VIFFIICNVRKKTMLLIPTRDMSSEPGMDRVQGAVQDTVVALQRVGCSAMDLFIAGFSVFVMRLLAQNATDMMPCEEAFAQINAQIRQFVMQFIAPTVDPLPLLESTQKLTRIVLLPACSEDGMLDVSKARTQLVALRNYTCPEASMTIGLASERPVPPKSPPTMTVPPGLICFAVLVFVGTIAMLLLFSVTYNKYK